MNCTQKKEKEKFVKFRIHHAKGFKVILETVQYINESQSKVDSGIVSSGDEELVFKIKDPEERAYKIRIPEIGFIILFISDSPLVLIESNILQPDSFKVKNSPATQTIRKFLNAQLQMMTNARNVDSKIDSLRKINAASPFADSLERSNRNQMADFFDRYKNFADTVSSPGAFLYIYNNVDFGKDFNGLHKFIIRASNRFPQHTRIQKLKNETLEFIKTLEEEYEVGQLLPSIQLKDISGNTYNTAFSKGKYIFLDIWASWNGNSLKYDKAKLEAKSKFNSDHFEIVSIGLEPEVEIWKEYIRSKKLIWIQLVDEKVWNGTVQNTLKIDSIPFNFLLNPDGRILRKAIPADSVVSVLSEYQAMILHLLPSINFI
jgi:hypothetical protein